MLSKKPQGIKSIRDDSRSQAAWLNFSGGGQGIESTDSFLRKAFPRGLDCELEVRWTGPLQFQVSRLMWRLWPEWGACSIMPPTRRQPLPLWGESVPRALLCPSHWAWMLVKAEGCLEEAGRERAAHSHAPGSAGRAGGKRRGGPQARLDRASWWSRVSRGVTADGGPGVCPASSSSAWAPHMLGSGVKVRVAACGWWWGSQRDRGGTGRLSPAPHQMGG